MYYTVFVYNWSTWDQPDSGLQNSSDIIPAKNLNTTSAKTLSLYSKFPMQNNFLMICVTALEKNLK